MSLINRLTDISFLASCATAIAVTATIVAVGVPLLERNEFKGKMKSVALERDRIRSRERERLQQSGRGNVKPTLRSTPGEFAKNMVERFNLRSWLSSESAVEKLMRAGLRGPKAETAFLVARLFAPLGLLALTLFYMMINKGFRLPFGAQAMIVLGAVFLGMKLPEIYLANITSKRQASMRQAFPDALDLLLICVESGMSIEQGFRKVAQEIGAQSIPLAEELTLATAELSYLSDRRMAYENLAQRTGLEGVKSVCMALVQAERYGTPLGQALRVLAQEFRDIRMTEAEKKAAALPPKLTVPMILFFLPVLFVVLLGPSAIEVMGYK
jgi:tight adherence protein C